MQINYADSLQHVLKYEGGYSNNPSDPGGPTNFGITLGDYRKYINPNGTAQDVANMKVSDAEKIYKAQYWDALSCDDLPSGVDFCIFDYGVNSGVGRALKVLVVFRYITDDVKLINAICDERMTFLQQLRTWPVFGAGWSARVAAVRSHALGLAMFPTTPSKGTT
jgi:lysozyme family protein